LQKDGKTMLKINHAEGLIDEMLTIKPNIIEVEPLEQTAIGKCDSAMTLYIFDFEISSKDEKFYSVVIADSKNHGIRVFIVQDLHADNVLPMTEEENTSECDDMSFFPTGTIEDFQNALRIVEVVQIVTWNL